MTTTAEQYTITVDGDGLVTLSMALESRRQFILGELRKVQGDEVGIEYRTRAYWEDALARVEAADAALSVHFPGRLP